MVLLLLYCPPGALSHRSHRLHHGEAGFRRHHRWRWLVWRWPRAPSGWAGSDWIWDLIGFENVLFFLVASTCYHMKWWSKMTILFVRGCSTANEQNPKLPNHAKVYAQRKKKHVTPWGASQKSKQVIQHHRNQSQLRTFPKTVVGFDGFQQCLVGVGNSYYEQIYCFLWFLLSMSPSIFYTLTFWRCPSCWVCFDSLQPVLHQFFFATPIFSLFKFDTSEAPTSEIPSPKQMNMLGGRPGNLDNLMLSWGWWIHCVQTCQVNGFG